MQQILTSKDLTEYRKHPSAFQPVGSVLKSPTAVGKKRDSGYGSDFSPAGQKSQTRMFTFDDSDMESEICDAFDDIDISADEDVFVDHFEPLIEVIDECDESDETDKEVEELFEEHHEEHTVTGSVPICRPQAPLPTPEVDDERDSTELCLISSPFYHTNWNNIDRFICKNPFRPIVSRSVGTQTPNPHCQLVQDALRSKQIALRRGKIIFMLFSYYKNVFIYQNLQYTNYESSSNSRRYTICYKQLLLTVVWLSGGLKEVRLLLSVLL
jgi:hypothetical protein